MGQAGGTLPHPIPVLRKFSRHMEWTRAILGNRYSVGHRSDVLRVRKRSGRDDETPSGTQKARDSAPSQRPAIGKHLGRDTKACRKHDCLERLFSERLVRRILHTST